MEFTEIEELNHLIKLNQHEERQRAVTKQFPYTRISQPNTDVTTLVKNILSFQQSSSIEIISQLQQFASSYYSGLSEIKQASPPPSPFVQIERAKAKTELPNFDRFDNEVSQLLFSRKKVVQSRDMGSILGRMSRMRSSMQKQSVYEKKIYRLKLFYFNSKVHKIIEYDSDTLAETVIKKAITLYLSDNSLDQSLLTTISKQAYDLCVCDDGSYTRDDDIPPIGLKKNIRDLNVDCLVLINNGLQVKESRELLDEYLTMNNYDRKSIVVISELGEQFLKINLEFEATAAIIYEKVEKMSSDYQEDKFYLAFTEQSSQGQQIPRDQKINDLPGTIYIRVRKFADEAIPFDQADVKPEEDLPEREDIAAPMGIGQASMYQEFPVVKINRRGARQHRILGIDQVKIYNFDLELRKQDKEVSFFSKMFGSVSQNFGTKTPERLVSDITNIKEIPQKNLLVIQFSNVFSSKSLEFEIESGTRKKIIEKLRVLRSHHKSKG